MHDTIVILDYGSQYSRLIARRVREANVFCELFSWRTPADQVMTLDPKGFILSGGPNSVYDPGAPSLPEYVIASKRPVLGICYGMQLLTHTLGGQVSYSQQREYGPAKLEIKQEDVPLFHGWLEDSRALTEQELDLGSSQVWMSHGDRVERLPPGFRPIASSDNSPFASAV
ncbi:MAG: gamma-glutamyl-gamma-aminobutyrate hydrolase family protein, partial [Chloroflexota bacterium]